jgi:hypothetical protein
MPDIPPVEQIQLIKYVSDYIRTITALSGKTIDVEFARQRGDSLVVKANSGEYKQKKYINSQPGQFLGVFSFMVLSTVAASDGEDSVLLATKPLQDIADDFDGLDISTLSLGDKRNAVKLEMTTQPQDMAGIQENGDITFFAVYTLTYRRKGA